MNLQKSQFTIDQVAQFALFALHVVISESTIIKFTENARF